MNEEELRKSVRRQKFEKSGLTLSSGNGSHTASTGTGTGTSDTEDEGSTPSADNADRSLASTLGGSSESIPQTSSSFLQAALPDGPGNLLERGSTSKIMFFCFVLVFCVCTCQFMSSINPPRSLSLFTHRSSQHKCQT